MENKEEDINFDDRCEKHARFENGIHKYGVVAITVVWESIQKNNIKLLIFFLRFPLIGVQNFINLFFFYLTISF